MKNRYDGILLKHNQDILALNAANQTLRAVTAYEIRKACKPRGKVLEIGCGEGDSAEEVLRKCPDLSLTCLDISEAMISAARLRLAKLSTRVRFVALDALEYLDFTNEPFEAYDVIFSEWTVHNFLWEDKHRLFKAVHKRLVPGGRFILMDKVYPSRNNDARKVFDALVRRYRYLDPVVAEAIIKHETEDLGEQFCLNNQNITAALVRAGFSGIRTVDRVEKDVVMVAQKLT